MAKIGHAEIEFETHTEKKGSWRFEELGADPIVRSLYVQKGPLADLGYEPGDHLRVTIEVIKA